MNSMAYYRKVFLSIKNVTEQKTCHNRLDAIILSKIDLILIRYTDVQYINNVLFVIHAVLSYNKYLSSNGRLEDVIVVQTRKR